ncbi:TetR/AcrR family transcriptional regulator [soil metagenome]
MAKLKTKLADTSTEEKIKEAARKVFLKKGYAATRTRDIAEESGINLALLNYYFRSKEKLFQLVMSEKVQKLFGTITPILNDADTTLEKKIELITSSYALLLIENPDLPLFVLSEMKNHPDQMAKNAGLGKILQQSVFIQQIKEKRPDINPLQFFINILGMIIFPFIIRPVLNASGSVSNQAFSNLVEERKKMIPKWAKAMLKVS